MMRGGMKNKLREAYNKNAHLRDAKAVQDWKKKERSKFLSLLLQEQKETLLEIGAGPGKDSLFFQEGGFKVFCIDLSPEMVNICMQKGLKAKVMDFSNLRFPDGSFDSVYALNCLLHLRKKELPSVLVAINAILKSGGLLYMGMYGGYDYEGIWPDDPYEPKRFFSFYDDDHLKRVVSEVFEVESFNKIDIGQLNTGLHFQSVVLRKRNNVKSIKKTEYYISLVRVDMHLF